MEMYTGNILKKNCFMQSTWKSILFIFMSKIDMVEVFYFNKLRSIRLKILKHIALLRMLIVIINKSLYLAFRDWDMMNKIVLNADSLLFRLRDFPSRDIRRFWFQNVEILIVIVSFFWESFESIVYSLFHSSFFKEVMGVFRVETLSIVINYLKNLELEFVVLLDSNIRCNLPWFKASTYKLDLEKEG